MQSGGTIKYVATKLAVWLWLWPKACHAPQASRGYLLGFASTRTWRHGQNHGTPSGAGGTPSGAGPLMAQRPLVARPKGLPHQYYPTLRALSSWPLEGGRRIRRMAAGVWQRLTRVCLVCLMTRSATPPYHFLTSPPPWSSCPSSSPLILTLEV